jgi:hypothetical protein
MQFCRKAGEGGCGGVSVVTWRDTENMTARDPPLALGRATLSLHPITIT